MKKSLTYYSLFELQKPGKWNAVHVRIAWEIYQTQQRQGRGEAQQDSRKPLNLNLTPKLNLGPPPSSQPSPLPSVSKATTVVSGTSGPFDPMPSPMNLHNSSSSQYNFSHHQHSATASSGSFLSRLSSSATSQQSLPTPASPLPPPPPGGVRSSPLPDQWNRYTPHTHTILSVHNHLLNSILGGYTIRTLGAICPPLG